MGRLYYSGFVYLGADVLATYHPHDGRGFESIDDSFRHGSLALGATKLQTIRRVVLPMAFPNIITGLILSIGRVSGETAPILLRWPLISCRNCRKVFSTNVWHYLTTYMLSLQAVQISRLPGGWLMARRSC